MSAPPVCGCPSAPTALPLQIGNRPSFPGGAHTAEPRDRAGLEQILARFGLSHFCVDTHLITQARPIAYRTGDTLTSTSAALAYWDTARGWGSPLEPVTLAGRGRHLNGHHRLRPAPTR